MTGDNIEGNDLGQSGLFSNTLFEQMYDLSSNIVNSTNTTQVLIDTMNELKVSLDRKISKPSEVLKKAFTSMSSKITNNSSAILDKKNKINPIINNITNNYFNNNSSTRSSSTNNTIKKQYRAEGGFISGRTGKDTIPAMLTDGEYVIRRESAQKLGPEFLNAINQYGTKGYNRGGPIKRRWGGPVGAGFGALQALGTGALNAFVTSVAAIFNPLFKKALDLFTKAIYRFHEAIFYLVKSIPKLLISPFKVGLEITKLFGSVGNKIIEERNSIRQTLSDMRETASMFSRSSQGNPQGVQRFMGGNLRKEFLAVDSLLVNTFGRAEEGLKNMLTSSKENISNMGDYMETVGKGIFGDKDKMIALQRAVGSLGLEAEDIFYNAQQASKDQESIFGRLAKVLKINKDVAKAMGVDEKRLAKRFNELRKDITNFSGMSDKALMNVAARMNKFKISSESAQAVFNKFTDFESAAKSAAMLSQAFGMNIDALKLIKAEDPMEIIEHMRDAFLETGRSFDSMNRFERGLLERETGLSSKTLKSVMQYRKMGYDSEAALKRAKQDDSPEGRQIKAINKLTSAMDSFKETINTLVFDSPLDAFMTMLKENIRVSDDGKQAFGQISKSLTDFGTSINKVDLSKLMKIVSNFVKPFIKAAKHDIKHMEKVLSKSMETLEFFLNPGKKLKPKDRDFDKKIKDRKNQYFNKMKELYGVVFGVGDKKGGFQLGKKLGEMGLKAAGVLLRAISGVQGIVFTNINKALSELRSYIRGEKSLEGLEVIGEMAQIVADKLGMSKREILDIGKNFTKGIGEAATNVLGLAWDAGLAGLSKLRSELNNPTSFLNLQILPMVEPAMQRFGEIMTSAIVNAFMKLDELTGGILGTLMPGYDSNVAKAGLIGEELVSNKVLVPSITAPDGRAMGFRSYRDSPVFERYGIEEKDKKDFLINSIKKASRMYDKRSITLSEGIDKRSTLRKLYKDQIKTGNLSNAEIKAKEDTIKSLSKQILASSRMIKKNEEAKNLLGRIKSNASELKINETLETVRFLFMRDIENFYDITKNSEPYKKATEIIKKIERSKEENSKLAIRKKNATRALKFTGQAITPNAIGELLDIIDKNDPKLVASLHERLKQYKSDTLSVHPHMFTPEDLRKDRSTIEKRAAIGEKYLIAYYKKITGSKNQNLQIEDIEPFIEKNATIFGYNNPFGSSTGGVTTSGGALSSLLRVKGGVTANVVKDNIDNIVKRQQSAVIELIKNYIKKYYTHVFKNADQNFKTKYKAKATKLIDSFDSTLFKKGTMTPVMDKSRFADYINLGMTKKELSDVKKQTGSRSILSKEIFEFGLEDFNKVLAEIRKRKDGIIGKYKGVYLGGDKSPEEEGSIEKLILRLFNPTKKRKLNERTLNPEQALELYFQEVFRKNKGGNVELQNIFKIFSSLVGTPVLPNSNQQKINNNNVGQDALKQGTASNDAPTTIHIHNSIGGKELPSIVFDIISRKTQFDSKLRSQTQVQQDIS